MYFFGKQRTSKTHSSVLLIGFLVAMVLFMVVVHLSVHAFSLLLGESPSIFIASLQTKVMVGLIWFAVIAGCFFRYLDVRAGGAALARRFGADPANAQRRHSKDQELIDTVSEMAIASSSPEPEVFVMRNQHTINAFVVGSIDDAKPKAIVVTQGALDQLDREELQSVVAHEFGHIAQGDIPINMRMLILMGGLLAIDEIGTILIPKESFHFGILVGIPLRILGSIGVFMGSLIRSAFSRQREFLADASGVQYTRDPLAMASALAKIDYSAHGQTIQSRHAGELAHLCFHTATSAWFASFLNSHPPIQKRIDEIDPHFSVKKRTSERAKAQTAEGVSTGWDIPVTREKMISAEPLSDRVSLLITDTPSCLAALFAVFASDTRRNRDEYIDAIGFAFNPLFAQQVKHVLTTIPDELRNNKASIIDRTTKKIRDTVQLENRQKIMLNLEHLLVVEDEFNILSYASAQLVRRQLDVDFPMVRQISGEDGRTATQTSVKTFDDMGEEFALLLSLMVESSGASDDAVETEFNKVLRFYTDHEYPLRSGTEPGVFEELESAFQTLYVQPKHVKQSFVQHCVEIMHSDGHVASAEEALIGLFAAALDCDLKAA